MTPDLTKLVRPLIWRQQSVDCLVAETQFGAAAVQNESHALALNRWGWWMAGSDEDDSPTGYGDTLEAAQSAANADHAARVIAALDAELLAEVVGALRAALLWTDSEYDVSAWRDDAEHVLTKLGVQP